MNKDVQAFELFAKGLKPVDVIMKLNIQVDQVKRLACYFWFEGIKEGENWNERIAQFLEHTTHILILWSKNASESKGFLSELKRLFDSKQARIIILKLDYTPLLLELTRYVNEDNVTEALAMLGIRSLSETSVAKESSTTEYSKARPPEISQAP